MFLAGWFRTEGSLKEAKLQLELFRDRKYWVPRTPTEEEPRETFTVELKRRTLAWEYASAKITPKHRIKRFRLCVLAESAGGTVWVDDLALRPVGEPVASPNMTGALDDALTEPTEPDEDTAMLGAFDDGADAKDNLLKNPGFEKPMTTGVVTPKSDRPSPYGPIDTPDTWMKTKSGSGQ